MKTQYLDVILDNHDRTKLPDDTAVVRDSGQKVRLRDLPAGETARLKYMMFRVRRVADESED
jgi:hypothetical protein